MGVEIKKADYSTWFIARSLDNKIIHTGFIEKGGSMKSAQTELELFEDEDDMKARLDELNE